MSTDDFEALLESLCVTLTAEAQAQPFRSSPEFEARVRELTAQTLQSLFGTEGLVNFQPHPHGFPDIGVGEHGIEVKFTTNDTWRSVANSVLETNWVGGVEHIYIVFGKMGGAPEVRWGRYEDSVVHVRTSHVPRFEVDLEPARSLFDTMGVDYNDFRQLAMAEKMRYIRTYARGRLRPGERLWWLDDSPEGSHSLAIEARLYTSLDADTKTRLRAEAALISPAIVSSGRSRNKYDDIVLYLLTYHGVLCHQARDLFSAGSVANPTNDKAGGIYIERALILLEDAMLAAAAELDDAVLVEYWGESVPPERRIARWLEKADKHATGWTPSERLFRGLHRVRRL